MLSNVCVGDSGLIVQSLILNKGKSFSNSCLNTDPRFCPNTKLYWKSWSFRQWKVEDVEIANFNVKVWIASIINFLT
jgi:hypothetical protein